MQYFKMIVLNKNFENITLILSIPQPITATFSGITKFPILQQKPKACSPIVDRLSGKVISSSLSQSVKAYLPISTRFFGNITLLRFLHQPKVDGIICVMPSGIVMLSRVSHPQKAIISIHIRLWGRFIFFIYDLPQFFC